MMKAVVFALAAASPASGLRKRKADHNASVVIRSKADCAALADMNIRGHAFGQNAVLLCQMWPGGKFPMETVQDAEKVLEKAFGWGGIWDDIQDLKKERSLSSKFCWKKSAMRAIESSFLQLNTTEQECEMVSSGVCYGDCPRGYKPQFLLGNFKPTCSSLCAESKHKYSCGFGCASSKWNCAKTVVDQVGEVARMVGKAGTFLTGNPAISLVVDKISKLIEFTITTLFKIVDMGKRLWRRFEDEESVYAIITVLFQFVQENQEEVGGDWEHMKGSMAEIVGIFVELTEAQMTWKTVNLGFVANTLLKHGSEILDSSYEVIQAFVYPGCEPADTRAQFAIEQAGDDRLLGAWEQTGEHDGRPRYTLEGESDAVVQWSASEEAWIMSMESEGTILYENPLDTLDYPVYGWQVMAGSEPSPEVDAIVKPSQLA